MPTSLEIAAHGETQLQMKVSPSMFGESESTITVLTNSKLRPNYEYRIRMVGADLPVPHILSQTPSIELFGDRASEALSGTVEIRTVENSGDQEWISGIETNSDQVFAKLRTPVERHDMGGGVVGRWYVFDITAKCPETGVLSIPMKVEVRGPEFVAAFTSQLTVKCLEKVKCLPAQITFASDRVPEYFDLLLISAENESFSVTSVVLVCGEARIPLYVEHLSESAAHKLSLAVPNPGQFPSTDPCQLEINCTICEAPLSVPVVSLKQR